MTKCFKLLNFQAAADKAGKKYNGHVASLPLPPLLNYLPRIVVAAVVRLWGFVSKYTINKLPELI